MTTAEAYREGLAYGRRIAEHHEGSRGANYAMEESLRFEASQYLAPSRRARRARALGELRGYRQAQP